LVFRSIIQGRLMFSQAMLTKAMELLITLHSKEDYLP
jgi:hypothetical protein